MSTRPEIVFLTAHLPFPPVSGGRLREFELLGRLARSYDVHVLALSKTYWEDATNAQLLLDRCASVTVFPAEPGRAPCAQMAAHRSRMLGKAVRRKLAQRSCDLIHVEGFHLAQHVPAAPGVPLVVSEQNIEYELWRQRARCECAPRTAEACLREYERTRAVEVAVWRRADACAAVSENDRTVMEGFLGHRVAFAPCGFDHLDGGSFPSTVGGEGDPLLVFVANFSYQPNRDGAAFLCWDVLPAVLARLPNARLALVGNDPDRQLDAYAGGHVLVTGRVDDVRTWLAAADIVVCPLRIGGGVKMKMLEALAFGKPIVTTSIGAQGLGDGDEAPFLLADRPADFAEAIVRLAQDPNERTRLSERARRFARRLPTWDEGAAGLMEAYAWALDSAIARPAAADVVTRAALADGAVA